MEENQGEDSHLGGEQHRLQAHSGYVPVRPVTFATATHSSAGSTGFDDVHAEAGAQRAGPVLRAGEGGERDGRHVAAAPGPSARTSPDQLVAVDVRACRCRSPGRAACSRSHQRQRLLAAGGGEHLARRHRRAPARSGRARRAHRRPTSTVSPRQIRSAARRWRPASPAGCARSGAGCARCTAVSGSSTMKVAPRVSPGAVAP